jgi:SAM-dependent methyltransferase
MQACPFCGFAFQVTTLHGNSACPRCHEPFAAAGNVTTWTAEERSPARRVWPLVVRQLHPLSSRFSPLRYFSDWRVEGYYRRTLRDAALATDWSRHYLSRLGLSAGAAVLDHGCGRGRHVALLTQLGFRVCAQDVRPHQWWRHFPDCTFQVVPAAAPRLPWPDATFQAVLDVNVVNHLDEGQVERLAREVWRVLAPGGSWILLEPNASSYSAAVRRRYYGRLYSLQDVKRRIDAVGFEQTDCTYHGAYAPVIPQVVNFFRKQAWPGPFTVDDFDSRLAAAIPERRRAQWLLRVRKPAAHA